MSVVFDEVEATVEPPVNELPEREPAEEPEETPNQLEKFYHVYMEHQRRTKRLCAD